MRNNHLKRLACLCLLALFNAAALWAQTPLEKPLRFFDGQKIRSLQIIQQNEDSQITAAQFFYNTRYYNLQFSEKMAATLKAAVNNYNSDFENKKLSRKNKKSFTKYGAATTRIEWGTSRQNIEQVSENACATFGYAFVQKSPYFTLSVRSAQSQNAAAAPTVAASGDIFLFFTRTQAAELVAALE